MYILECGRDMDTRLLNTPHNAYDGSCATYVHLSEYKDEFKSDFDEKAEKNDESFEGPKVHYLLSGDETIFQSCGIQACC